MKQGITPIGKGEGGCLYTDRQTGMKALTNAIDQGKVFCLFL
ncbi:MAG: hypothetical protein ACOH5I_25600 [Oligoflexus sp.]